VIEIATDGVSASRDESTVKFGWHALVDLPILSEFLHLIIV
jgi:hypothetical protein